jgi:hypothetical protein
MAEGRPDDAHVKRPLCEPSGQVPPASDEMSTWRAGGQVGRQPQTRGTCSPRAGAAPWLRAAHPNLLPAGQVFQAGGAALTLGRGSCGFFSGGGSGTNPGPVPLMLALGGGEITADTYQVRLSGAHVYVIPPQLPYEQDLPGSLQAVSCRGAWSGQPSVRFGSQRQRGSPGGCGTPLHGVERTQVHLP